VPLTLEDFERVSERTPILADLKPGGRFVAVDVDRAGGTRLLAKNLLEAKLVNGSARTVSGKTLQAEADKLQDKKHKNKSSDLEMSLFGDNGGAVEKRLEGTGGLYFSGAIKRYATGLAWVHEKDAPLSGWDFLLAICGALLLRGAVRSFRGSLTSTAVKFLGALSCAIQRMRRPSRATWRLTPSPTLPNPATVLKAMGKKLMVAPSATFEAGPRPSNST